jgi:GntR family transcriptional regulator/MocR family aminotransferase
MRLGWMLPPSWLSWALISAKAIEDAGSEITGQLALADFIARGELERHLRRMRLRYERRRECLLSALARELPDWRPYEGGGGLHVLTALPDEVDEPTLLTAAARHRARRPAARRGGGARWQRLALIALARYDKPACG